MAGRPTRQQEEAQARHDAAIWRTLQINELIDVGRFEQAETVSAVFAPRLSPQEKFLGAGPFLLYDFGAVGDGSYTRDSGFFFATGPAGLALTGGIAAVRALGNASRRSQAAADAVPRWKVIDSGQLWVTQAGLYLRGQGGFHVWSWPPVIAAELVGPGQLRIDGDADAGRVQWILQSDWAELAFTLWARSQHPQHPQFLGRSWVPPGWEQRTRARGYRPPPSLSGRWQPSDIQDT